MVGEGDGIGEISGRKEQKQGTCQSQFRKASSVLRLSDELCISTLFPFK